MAIFRAELATLKLYETRLESDVVVFVCVFFICFILSYRFLKGNNSYTSYPPSTHTLLGGTSFLSLSFSCLILHKQ